GSSVVVSIKRPGSARMSVCMVACFLLKERTSYQPARPKRTLVRQPTGLALAERRDDRIHIVDATAPRPTARMLKRCPQARIGGQRRVRGEIGSRLALGQHARALLGAVHRVALAHQIDRADQRIAVDDNLDQVAVADLTDRPARERLWANMPDARA